MTIRTLIFTLGILFSIEGVSQGHQFTQQDTLRGSITPERAWWDVTYYHLDIKVDPDNKYISGKNTVQYKVLKSHNLLMIQIKSFHHLNSLHFQNQPNHLFVKQIKISYLLLILHLIFLQKNKLSFYL